MEDEREGFLYPKINNELCADCKACSEVCGITRINEMNTESDPILDCYGAYCKQDDIRDKSSSGGVFYTLASRVLAEKGVVFGAAFNESFQVYQTAVTDAEHLEKLMGSKYVQSRTELTYREAEAYLREGKVVYYSGTPCQIAGLKHYLKKDYSKLITQDVICHGVPSPLVWDLYLQVLTQNGKKRINRISFRDKTHGWKRYCLKVEFGDGTRYLKRHGADPMLNAFVKNMCLRSSCYHCEMKSKSGSDITLGDFWGIEDSYPSFGDDRGVSAVLCHTAQGQRLLTACADELEMMEIPAETFLKLTPGYHSSHKQPENRDSFMREIQTNDFRTTVKKYCGNSFLNRLSKKCKHLLQKRNL